MVDKNTDPDFCIDCMWEARADIGIYDNRTKTPRDKKQKVNELYEDQFYKAHELQELPIRRS